MRSRSPVASRFVARVRHPTFGMFDVSPEAIVDQTKEMIYVVDDDFRVRESLSALLRSHGKNVATFHSGQQFLQHKRNDNFACLILDLKMPDMDGLQVQQQLAAKAEIPVIFMTGLGDIKSSVTAMKSGAVDFLTKPLDETSLLEAVEKALEKDRAMRKDAVEFAVIRALYDTLTPREQQVLALLVKGLLNKQVAGLLEISEHTIQVHRGRIMKKMQADSFATLVRLASRIQSRLQ